MRWVLSTKRPGIFYPSLNGVGNPIVNNKLSFQPNPVNSIVRFSFDAPIPNNSRIELFDLAGKCVRISEPVSARLNYEMDLSDLDKGIYMVRCTAPNGVVLSSATKLVKN